MQTGNRPTLAVPVHFRTRTGEAANAPVAQEDTASGSTPADLQMIDDETAAQNQRTWRSRLAQCHLRWRRRHAARVGWTNCKCA